MSQFAVCVFASAPPSDLPALVFVPLESEQDVYESAAREIYPEHRGAKFVPRCRDGRMFHDLFSEGHEAIISGERFEDTLFAATVEALLAECASFAFWWSSDWKDLPVFDDKKTLMEELRSQLGSPMGDVYLQWRRWP